MLKAIKYIVIAVLLILVINKVPTYFGSKHTLYSKINITMSDDIKKIRDGHLVGTSKVSISSALEGYFLSPKWGETVYSDMKVIMFQGEFKENGTKMKFQILFPKLSEFSKYGMASDINLNELPLMDTFINNMPNETKGKELLIKAYEAAGEKLE